MGRRRVAIVPHTHWDREWQAPFEVVRIDLVDLLDGLLDLLETDHSFTASLLAAQRARVDDSLGRRPEPENRSGPLSASGSLEVAPGPWRLTVFLVGAG